MGEVIKIMCTKFWHSALLIYFIQTNAVTSPKMMLCGALKSIPFLVKFNPSLLVWGGITAYIYLCVQNHSRLIVSPYMYDVCIFVAVQSIILGMFSYRIVIH